MLARLEAHVGAAEPELREFLPAHFDSFLPAIYGAPKDKLLDHIVRTVLGSDPLIVCRRDGRLCGVATLKRQLFDESIFGIGMGELRSLRCDGDYAEAVSQYQLILEEAFRLADEQGMTHLSCSIPVEDVAARHALERSGFLLMDTKVEYAWTPELVSGERKSYGYLLRAVAEPEEAATAIRLLTLGTTIRPFRSDDLMTLQAIAAEAFTKRTLTRYAVDPALPTPDTARLYSKWVENASDGRFGDLLMVAECEAAPVGFQMVRIENELTAVLGAKVGAMGIGAVSTEAPTQGAFPALLIEILAWCRLNEFKVVRGGVLVNNYRMHRSCIATGATVAACTHTFHAVRANESWSQS